MAITCLRTDFFERLQSCNHPVLLLDYDGTLAPFTVERDRAEPYANAIESLQRICRTTGTRTIFITGRAAGDLDRLLRPYELSCEIWGGHGRERLHPDGTLTTFEIEPEATQVLRQAETLLAMEGLGGIVELKPFSLAVHWRGLDLKGQRDTRIGALRAFAFLRTKANCRLLEFDGGMELLVGRRDKGDAVRAILRELPAKTPVAYLGDDLTDEDAFLALGDAGLTVLVRPELRPTAAQLWIRPPHELTLFLETWLDSCGGAA
jgi:trehalose 6-phosphate phosphatase